MRPQRVLKVPRRLHGAGPRVRALPPAVRAGGVHLGLPRGLHAAFRDEGGDAVDVAAGPEGAGPARGEALEEGVGVVGAPLAVDPAVAEGGVDGRGEGASGKVMIWGEVVDDDDDDDDDVVVVAAAEGVSAAGVDVEAEVDADADAEVEAREFLGFALAFVVVGGAGEGFIASTAAALTERRVLRLGMLATLSLETNVATRAPR
ncbi:hypothetical protein ACCO45_012602 [Purpureocillium lilacinum]|uniref:Uncharacterized protein n=1 Tax=Purpureocillium lilacinum TaxID=33203 RepID=A0ACC4DA04_PURLI